MGTRHVRVFEDLADMIGWIHHFRNQGDQQISVAQILDDMLRTQVVKAYEPYQAAVAAIEKAEQAAARPPDKKKGKG